MRFVHVFPGPPREEGRGNTNLAESRSRRLFSFFCASSIVSLPRCLAATSSLVSQQARVLYPAVNGTELVFLYAVK